jgi:hypothetical protein
MVKISRVSENFATYPFLEALNTTRKAEKTSKKIVEKEKTNITVDSLNELASGNTDMQFIL